MLLAKQAPSAAAANTMDAMRRHLRSVVGVLAAASAGVAVGACGSQTKTVTVTGAAPTAQSTATAGAPAVGSSTTPPTTTSAPGAGGTAAPTSPRTAPEPAFTQQEAHAAGPTAASALVRAHGFTPNDTSEYHSGQTLRVLVATRTGSGDGYGQQAFFFVGDRYIGTDTKEPSASVRVVSQGDTEVTLAYPLYRPADPLSSPSGGTATVHFQLNNGKLTAVGRIPPASSTGGLSRN